MKALIIAPQPFFKPRGTPLSAYYRTMMMAKLGVEADLLTYGEGDDVEIAGVRIVRIPRFSLLGPVKIGPSALKLFLDIFIAAWAVGLLLRNRYDFVHAHEEAVFIGRFLKPIFGFQLVYDMHSSLPQQLANFRYTKSRLLVRLFEALEASSLKHSDAVITISPELARYTEARIPDRQRHFMIENFLLDEVKLHNPGPPFTEEELKKALPAERPIVAYAGNFEDYQGLELLLEAFTDVRKSLPDTFLLLIGGTPEQVAGYRELAKQLGLEGDTLFTGHLGRALTSRLLRGASVVTSPRTAGTNTPLKIYELLTIGVPLVATRVIAHTQVLSDEICFLAEPERGALARAILTALGDSERSSSLVAAAQELYSREYSRDAYRQKLKSFLELLH